jgi:hypothetical protein
MELLESNDPEKKRLIEASERHKRALEKDFMGLSGDTQKLLTNALIIGGVLAVSYFVVRQFSSSKPKRHKKTRKVTVVQPAVSNDQDDGEEDSHSPSLLANIGQRMANQATIVLIDIARQKLMEYLESRKKGE